MINSRKIDERDVDTITKPRANGAGFYVPLTMCLIYPVLRKTLQIRGDKERKLEAYLTYGDDFRDVVDNVADAFNQNRLDSD